MLSEMAGRFQAVSINPMFAPRVGWKDQCVAIVELIGGPKASILKEFLRQWGARLEETTAGEHDRLTGLIQVATHAAILSVGAALLSTNLELDRVLRFATPPHKLLLLLIHRLTTQSPEVYWDVQAFHPFGYGVRDQLIAALRAIQEDAKSEDQTRFFGLLGDLRKLLKDQEDLFVQWTKKALTI
jgi:prephenate dehydrogenase